MRIGLLGGSFNPPHAAHRLITLEALKRLGLDAVWWLVTPGNPLKDVSGLPATDERLALARAEARHPLIKVTAIEEAMGTRYTADTLRLLQERCPGVRFVWLMGADNLLGFHRWGRWREIARMMPIAVFDRPQAGLKAPVSRAARCLAAARLPERAAPRLALARAPAWIFIHGPKSPLSSTAIRAMQAR
jgi:nicotinate-nucleotide adenylyltransferase